MNKKALMVAIWVIVALEGAFLTGVGIASSDAVVNLIGLSALGIGIFLAAYHYYSDPFSPIGLLGIGWFLPLAVSQLYLSDHQSVLDSLTWVALLGSAAAFTIGVLTVLKIHPVGTTWMKRQDWLDLYDPMRLRLGITALAVIAAFAFWYEVRTGVGVPALMPSDVRTLAYVTLPKRYIHYLTTSAIPTAALAIAYIRAFGYRKCLWELFLLVLMTLLLFSILARLQLIMVLLCGLAVVNYTVRRVNLASLVILGIVLLIGMIWTSEFRTGTDVDYPRRAYLLSRMPQWANFAVWPYAYTSLNFELLRRIIHGNYPRTLGVMTLRPILAFTFTRERFPVPDFETDWFNTGTYLWELYSDFGIVGCLTIPFLYGALTALFYNRTRTRPTMGTVLIYGLIMYSVVFLFQGNGFAYPPLYFFALEIWFITKIAKRKSLSPPLAGQ